MLELPIEIAPKPPLWILLDRICWHLAHFVMIDIYSLEMNMNILPTCHDMLQQSLVNLNWISIVCTLNICYKCTYESDEYRTVLINCIQCNIVFFLSFFFIIINFVLWCALKFCFYLFVTYWTHILKIKKSRHARCIMLIPIPILVNLCPLRYDHYDINDFIIISTTSRDIVVRSLTV